MKVVAIRAVENGYTVEAFFPDPSLPPGSPAPSRLYVATTLEDVYGHLQDFFEKRVKQ